MAQEQELRLKFQQKLIEILELGKKKKNMLEYQEIADFFKDLNLDPEKFEMVIDYLEQNGIDVLKISNDDDVDDDIILDEEDEVEVEKIDLSVPEGVSVEDPVRMYLKEIGKVPLLSADEEIELAQNMEDGAVAIEKINVLKGRLDSASEDVGLANPNALLLANAAFDAVNKIGWPEGRIPLAEATVYLATSPKSNSAYLAVDEALACVRKTGNQPVPLHLRNAPTQLMKSLGYHDGYKYAHDFPDHFVEQQYLPDQLKDSRFWHAQHSPSEEKQYQWMLRCWGDRFKE